MSLKEEDESCVQAMLFATAKVFPMVLKAAIELKLFDIMLKQATVPMSHPRRLHPGFRPETLTPILW